MDRNELFDRYSELVLRHERMIRALCLRHTDDDEELKDLAQEVRIALWERYASCGGSLGAWPEGLWVFWRTRSVVSHRRRLAQPELVRLDDRMVEGIAEGDDAAESLIDDLAEGLAPEYARLLRLLREGYSVAEVAAMDGELKTTVSARRQRLVALLRQRAAARGMMEEEANDTNDIKP